MAIEGRYARQTAFNQRLRGQCAGVESRLEVAQRGIVQGHASVSAGGYGCGHLAACPQVILTNNL
jgi:hypothetical protein